LHEHGERRREGILKITKKKKAEMRGNGSGKQNGKGDGAEQESIS